MIAKPETCAAQISKASPLRPTFAMILGSGFGPLAERLERACVLPYGHLPGFLPARIDGHEGKLMVGLWAGVPVLLLCGRSHYYEGHSMADLTFPVRVLAECGIETVLLTNAAGGINPAYRPGDFMCLTDHLNFMGASPLRGPSAPGAGARFVDLSETYDPSLRKLLEKAARGCQARLHWGVYLAVSGPAYETPAEIRAFARLGADAVGMSTVPEAIVARQCGLRVAGLSCITNRAAGLSATPISHTEVLSAAARAAAKAAELLTGFVFAIGAARTKLNRSRSSG